MKSRVESIQQNVNKEANRVDGRRARTLSTTRRIYNFTVSRSVFSAFSLSLADLVESSNNFQVLLNLNFSVFVKFPFSYVYLETGRWFVYSVF